MRVGSNSKLTQILTKSFGSRMARIGSSMGGTSQMSSVMSKMRKLSMNSMQGDHEELIKMLLDQQAKMLDKIHNIELKNVKSIAMQEAMEFVKKQSVKVASIMTKEHHKMTRQFLDYKSRTIHIMETNNGLKEEIKEVECALALKYPVDDFDFVHPEENPLKLYDCLIPEVRKNRQFRLG